MPDNHYGLNNPVKYTDPSGHCVVAPPFDTAACIIGGSISLGTLAAGGAAAVALGVVIADALSPEFNPISDASEGITSAINDAADDAEELGKEILRDLGGQTGSPGGLDPNDENNGPWKVGDQIDKSS